ncbi:unnamed protein product, partial [Pylaiella littoralis]
MRGAFEDVPNAGKVNELAQNIANHIEDGLRGDTDRAVSVVLERGDALFNGRLDWLGPLWAEVKGLPPTTHLIVACWTGYVDGLAALEHRKADTKTATAFTLTRFAGWGERLQTWINDPSVLEAGFKTAREEIALHYLCCIINHVEEELYNFFVEERKNAIAIKLEYPSQKYLIAKPRARV